MALDMSFANTAPPGAGSGVLGMPTAAPPQVAVPSVLGPAPVPPAAPPPQGGGPLSGIGGVLGGIASLPGNYLSAMGAQWQDAAAQHQMNMQMAKAKYAQFQAQMEGLRQYRETLPADKQVLFDTNPLAFAEGDEKLRELGLTPTVVGKGQGVATFAGGLNNNTLVPDISVDSQGDVVDASRGVIGNQPVVHYGAPNESASSSINGPHAPLVSLNGTFGGVPQPATPAPPGAPSIGGVDPASSPTDAAPAPSITGGVSQSWAANALKAPARAVAGQIAAHPAMASLSPQDQANVLTTGFRESAFNPNASNGSSTSIFEFQPAAWAMFGGGGDIHNVNDQVAAEVKMYAYNKALLTKKLPHPPTGADLYMTAMQGSGGGPALLTAAPGVNAVTALRNAGVPSATALQSIAGNLPGYKYKTPEQKQIANSAAMKMSAQDYTNLWAGIYNKTQAAMFSGAHGAAQLPSAPQAGNVWANGNAAAPGGPSMSVSGQPVPPPPAPPPPAAGQSTDRNGVTFTTLHQGQAADIPLAPGDPRLQYQPKGSSGFLGPDGTIRVTAPPVTESDFSKLGSDYLSDSEVHQPAIQRSGDLAALSQSIASLPPSAMQSQQALNTYFGSITNSKQPKPKSLDDFVNTMGISEATHRFLSANTPGGLGQTITPDSFKQLYRTAYIATAQSNKADASRLAPVLAAAEKYGYDASPYIKNQPQMPAVPALMQDALPAANGRHVGTVAWSPKGPLRWDGKVWRPQ